MWPIIPSDLLLPMYLISGHGRVKRKHWIVFDENVRNSWMTDGWRQKQISQ